MTGAAVERGERGHVETRRFVSASLQTWWPAFSGGCRLVPRRHPRGLASVLRRLEMTLQLRNATAEGAWITAEDNPTEAGGPQSMRIWVIDVNGTLIGGGWYRN